MLLTAYSLSPTPSFAQGIWTARDTLPFDTNAMVQGITGFSIGNYGYAGLGQNGISYSDELWQFDAINNSWAKKASFPGSARVAPASFVIGDKAYLVTGSIRNGSTCLAECWEYDATASTWTQKANFPGSVRTYAVGFAIDSLGYVGTGANELSDFCKDFYAYHPSTNTWSRIADFAGIARDGDCGFAVNGKGYVCFGQDSTIKFYNDIWEYDPGTNTWTQKSNCPCNPTLGASGFAICNNIYIGSGDDSGVGWDPVFWQYNTVLDSWTQEASVPGITKIEGAAFSIEDTGYYGFGFDSVGAVLGQNVFDKFFAGDSCSIITSYNTVINVSGISIYPDPTNQNLNIKYNGQISGLTTLSIMDITGREVLSCVKNINNDVVQDDVSFLSPAMYFISIKNKDIISNQKFIKINN
jgi:N-acetylneuraminic acid mutarotase